MSVVSEYRRNWMEEVKADAEAATRARLEAELPKLKEKVQQAQAAKAAPAVKEGKEAK